MNEDNLYDEFGNYIGPDIAENDDEDNNYQMQNNKSQANVQENEEVEEQEDIKQNEIIDENKIILYEDKKYYPDIEQVYPNAEAMVQDEDTQLITEPIIAPIKAKEFDLVEKSIPDITFSFDYLKNIMKNPELIRNIGIVGHLHHGKTSLLDLFVNETHSIQKNQDKDLRYTDTRLDEQERLISIKSTPMSMILQDLRGKSYAFNIFDTPGHVNFSDEQCSALRACDGAILVVDAIEGVMLGTERLIKYLVHQQISITLFINKIDRLIIELKLPPADAYLKLRHTIEEINDIIQKEEFKVSPLLGNVVFGSTQFNFLFSLTSFAMMYEQSFQIQSKKFSQLLWGNIYFDPASRKFTTVHNKDNKRTFVEFILEPVYKLFSHTCSKEKDDLKPVLSQLGIYLTNADYKLDMKPLLRLIFSKFFGNTAPIVSMVVQHIPSAKNANLIKFNQTYSGVPTQELSEAVKKCSASGPLLINVFKQYNKQDCLTFDVLGRVISGTIKRGQQVKVLGESYNLQDEEDMTIKQVKNLWLHQARYRVEMSEVTAGNWVLIEGIDQSITKSATIISTDEKLPIEIFRPIKFNTTPVIKVAIEPLIPSELPKMLEGLRKVNKSYPQLITKVEESGEHILIGTGELYMDCVLHDLRKMYSEIEIKVSDPSVSFCETVIDTSSIKCYAETPNKKNKLTMTAGPLDNKLADDIENEHISLEWESKTIQNFFQTQYEWDILASKNVWSFGPTKNGPNLIMDDTLPMQVDKKLLKTCKETIIQGFQWATREGPLCEEPVRNVKYKIIEADISDEVLYRGGGQIIPTARRTCYNAFLMATPRMMEPSYLVEIQCTADCLDAILNVLQKRRGQVIKELAKPGSPLYTVKCQLPAIDSFGFETDLRVHTSGQAFCLSVFDKWELLSGDPLDKNIKLNLLEPSQPQDLAREFMIKTRRRKGLNENVSIIKYFDDTNLIEQLKQEKDYIKYI